MYRIVGKENLASVNEVAQRSLIVLHNLSETKDEVIKIDKDMLASLASGYLYLYQVVLDEGLVPNTRSSKHNIFNLH